MKKQILISFLILIFSDLFSQKPGQWAWMHGTQTPDAAALYGTQGIPSPTNTPGNLYEPMEWTDTAGNFWLYGGWPNPKNNGFAGALWKYDSKINQWTWMHGNKGQGFAAPVYGTKGVSAPTNKPGNDAAKHSIVDKQGNLWLLLSNGDNNWKYDIKTNEWAWVSGSGGTYYSGKPILGVKGLAGVSNTPGYTGENACVWVDEQNNFWVYTYYQKQQNKELGILWKFETNTKQWAWMAGDTTNGNVYGPKGVGGAGFQPGTCWAYSHWTDLDGKFWMFGGYDKTLLPTTYGGYSCNLWVFDPKTNYWAFMGGSDSVNVKGNFGVKGVSSPSNWPSARYENRASWVDKCGNLWMFGGATSDGSKALGGDLWMYNIKKGEWTWMGGPNQSVSSATVWGQKGLWGPLAQPGGKAGAIAFTDKKGNFWLYGGDGMYLNKSYNDLWQFNTQPETVKTNATSCTVNDGAAQVDVLIGTPPYTYIWDANTITTTNMVSGLGVGNYTVTINDDAGCQQTDTFSISYPSAGPYYHVDLQITQPACAGANGSASVFPFGGASPYTYLWSDGQTNYFHSGLSAGSYDVTITDMMGCKFKTTAHLTDLSPPKINYHTISYLGCNSNNNASISTQVQGGISPYTYLWSNGETTASISGKAPGAYALQITDANGCSSVKEFLVNPSKESLILNITSTGVGCTKPIGSAQVNVSGGISPYIYNWNTSTGTQTTQIITGLDKGHVSVIVSDASGCKDSATVEIGVFYAPLLFSLNKTSPSSCKSSNGQITVQMNGGIPPYTYSWSANAGGQTDSVATGLQPGIYEVEVTDFGGCKRKSNTNLGSMFNNYTLSVTVVNAECYNDSGSVSANAYGATGPYVYLWETGETTQTIGGLAGYEYIVQATDSFGCITTGSAQIYYKYSPVIFSTSQTEASCYTCIDGEAFTSVLAGASPYSYSWTMGSFQSTASSISGLTPGAYTICVTDASNCTYCKEVIIGTKAVGIEKPNYDNNFKAYPNPAKEKIAVEINGILTNNIELQLLNILGERVFFKNEIISGKPYSLNIDLGDIPSGQYVLQLKTTEALKTIKIIIDK